ncbi:MAG: hypothetical protein UX89_C0013G0018 [Parcubacteria group bacterium GW2011_GWA2_47_16]|nr:MAG: hypothetical protein UX89_C0013G0018 [Parcubacteria group bacterium GW2011_GWA2_47_16]
MKNLLKSWFKKDEFLDEVKRHQGLYQLSFVKLTEIADAKIWAKLILNPKFALSEDGMKKIEAEEKNTDPVFKEATEKGLNQIVLLVLYLQYATADPLFDQNTKKPYWVTVVQNRKPVDSFPHHNAIVSILNKLGYIQP